MERKIWKFDFKIDYSRAILGWVHRKKIAENKQTPYSHPLHCLFLIIHIIINANNINKILLIFPHIIMWYTCYNGGADVDTLTKAYSLHSSSLLLL